MGASQQTGASRDSHEALERVKPKLYRKFQVQKSTALGLVIPQNLRLEIRHVDSTDGDLGAAYRTGTMCWLTVMTGLPPPFTLYRAHADPVAGVATEKDEPVARIVPTGWQGLYHPKAEVQMLKVDSWLRYDHELPSDIRGRWSIQRPGWGRHYEMTGHDESGKAGASEPLHFVWKGSKSVLHALEDYNPRCNGNLKLESDDGEILAVWKQQRDAKVFGSIHVFESARDLVPVEVIIASCLCIAIEERISGVSFVGGLGK